MTSSLVALHKSCADRVRNTPKVPAQQRMFPLMVEAAYGQTAQRILLEQP